MISLLNNYLFKDLEILNSMVQNSSQTLMISDMGLSMSVPTHLLRMSSPVLSVLLDQPPCLTTSLILPDADIKTLAVLIELLSKGKTKESSSSMISPLNDLADLLGISNFNVDAKEIANSAHDSRKPLKKEEKVNRGLESGKPQQKDVINLNDTLNADPTDVEENKSICFKCDKTFSSSSNLIFHICTHFTDDLKVFIEEDQSCGICSEKFLSIQGLLRHIGITHGKLEDILTSSGLPTTVTGRRNVIASGRNRVRKNHEIKELFQCSLCEKEMPSASALTMHLIGSHNFLREVRERYQALYQDNTCVLCQKRFAKSSIWQHLGSVHNKLDEILLEKGLKPVRRQKMKRVKSEVDVETESAGINILDTLLFEDVDKDILDLNVIE